MKKHSISRIKRVFRVGIIALMVATSGCGYESEISIDLVAFCGTVMDAGAPVTGPVHFEASVVDRSTALVYHFQGDTTLDGRGVGCVDLVNGIQDTFREPLSYWERHLSLQTLTATARGTTASGVITFVDNEGVSLYMYVEAAFDLSRPDPGPPGQLAILNLMNHFTPRASSASRISDDAIAVAPGRSEGDRSPHPAPGSSGQRAI